MVPSTSSLTSMMLFYSVCFTRIEKVRVKEVRGIAKIVGTLVTFGGAILMTVYKGPIINLWSGQHSSAAASGGDSHKHWIAGTFFILIGCCAWSAFYILQVSPLSFTLFLCKDFIHLVGHFKRAWQVENEYIKI